MSETDGYTTDGGTSYTASTRGSQPRRVTASSLCASARGRGGSTARRRPTTAHLLPAAPRDGADESDAPLTVNMKDSFDEHVDDGRVDGGARRGDTSATGARSARPTGSPRAQLRARATYNNLSRRLKA